MPLVNYLDLDNYTKPSVKIKLLGNEYELPKKVAKYELIYQKYLKIESEKFSTRARGHNQLRLSLNKQE